MTTIWKGAINFGLINVPVKLVSAVGKENISFKSLHKECKTPINQKRWCSECDKEVPYADIVKGYEYEKGSFVEITNEELKSIPVKSAKYIQIADFISLDEVDPIYFEKSYFLAPEPAGEKPYLILYKAMKEMRSVAVAKITLREKEHLCLVRVYEDILMLNTMFFAPEIKPTGEINIAKIEKKAEVSKIEMDMAKEIVKNLTARFDPLKYTDEYYDALMEIISAKIEGSQITQPKMPKINDSVKALDLFERLKASVEATKNGGKGTTAKENKPASKEKATPAKKALEKEEKTVAKKASSKKASAEKTNKEKTPAKKEKAAPPPKQNSSDAYVH